MSETREPGYYRVKYKGEWIVARWYNYFEIPRGGFVWEAGMEILGSDFLEEIDESRIPMPGDALDMSKVDPYKILEEGIAFLRQHGKAVGPFRAINSEVVDWPASAPKYPSLSPITEEHLKQIEHCIKMDSKKMEFLTKTMGKKIFYSTERVIHPDCEFIGSIHMGVETHNLYLKK